MEYLLVVCLFFGSTFGQDGKEIEARRRSALDKNFMRFGRTYPNAHMLYHMAATAEDNSKGVGLELIKKNSNKETRTPVKNANFLRFGRAGNSFMRLGRSENRNMDMEDQDVAMMMIERPQTRSNGYLRFGRAYPPQQPAKVFVPAGAIWPLHHQQQPFGQEEDQEEDLQPEGEMEK